MRVWKRPVSLASVIAIVSVLGAGLWLQRENASAASTAQDKIIYSQQNGKNGTYLQYVPGDPSKPTTTQSVTGAGGCATPNTTNPVLAFSANYYANGYSGTSTGAIVGAFNQRTGVCAVPQTWSIEPKEGLVFAPGPNALTAGRLFSSAQIQLEREDKASSGTADGQLVMRVGTNPPVIKPFSIPVGPAITVDTGAVPTGFDSLEIQVSTGSVSVVGPTSTFWFAKNICGGQPVSVTSTDGGASSGQITATFTIDAPSTVCKSYTDLSASVTTGKIQFLSQQVPNLHITSSFDWGNVPYCRADGGAPACPTTQVDFGHGFVDQTFCDQATHASDRLLQTPTMPLWCTYERNIEYKQDPADATKTVAHITEKWDGYGDITFRH